MAGLIQFASALCAVSTTPRDSMRRKTSRNCGGVMPATGAGPIHGNTQASRRATILSASLRAQPPRFTANH